MKTKTKVVMGAAAIASIIVGLAFATPIVNLVSPILSAGKQNANIKTHGVGQTSTGQAFEVHLHTEGPSTITTQVVSYAAGGQTGWHSHPGMVAVTLIAGSIQWFDEDCTETDYTVGDSWTEGSQIHFFRVVGPLSTQATATFITAQGAPLRIDQPAPACAAALGLT
jgi:quercetin dioxygenase-like cupin family protein